MLRVAFKLELGQCVSTYDAAKGISVDMDDFGKDECIKVRQSVLESIILFPPQEEGGGRHLLKGKTDLSMPMLLLCLD